MVGMSTIHGSMAISDKNIAVKVVMSKSRYAEFRKAAQKDGRSFSNWASIACEEKIVRQKRQ